ncbi:MAG: hypothetical protein JWO88_3029 [Frankiales bacterium]|nr:hypothetical protein [Frankiales bacterium]
MTSPAHHPAERVIIDAQGPDATVLCLLCRGNVTIDLDQVNELADEFEQFVRDHRNC